MEWALLGLLIFFILLTYILVQGTRAAVAWRKAASEGDVKVIRDIVDDALNGWRSQKRPKAVPLEVWKGIQSLEVVDVAPAFVHVSAKAESEYKMVDGNWTEVRNPLQEGMKIAAKACDMLFYELAHFRPDTLQVDVYSIFRDDERGGSHPACILSILTPREEAKSVDWEEWTAEEVVDAIGARYRMGEFGQPLPVQPFEYQPPEEPETKGEPDGSRSPARQ